jgi:hypothetical protein
MRQYKLFISISIFFIIGVHVLPVIQKTQNKRQTFWPIMAWGMYKNSRNAGPIRTVVTRIIGVTSQGKEEPVDAKLVGLSSFALGRLYLDSMRAGDSSAALRLADRLNLHRQDLFIEFRLESETYTITDNGIVKNYNPVITYRVVY